MQLTPEKLFFTKLIREGDHKDYVRLKSRGLSSKFFPEFTAPVFDYVDSYLLEYKQLPSEDEILDKYGQFNSVLFDATTPKAALGAIYDSVVSDSLRSEIHEALQSLAKDFNDNQNPFEILKSVQEEARKLTTDYLTSRYEMQTFTDLAKFLLDELDGKIEVKKGIPAAALFVEDQTFGWQPGGLTTIAAKTGVGKSWMLLLNVVTAITGNPFHFYDKMSLPEGLVFPTQEEKDARAAKCLFVSLEMPSEEIARRLAALVSKVSFARYMSKTMTAEEEAKIRKVLTYISTDATGDRIGAKLKVIGPNSAKTPEEVHAAAEDFEADFVGVDAFYMLQGPTPGLQRWQNVEANMQKMRMHTLQTLRHYMLATQLKPDAKTLSSTSIDTLSFSSSIGHDSTNVYALVQSKAEAESNTVNFLNLKMRGGVPGQCYLYDWDHQECLYTERGLAADEDDDTPLNFI